MENMNASQVPTLINAPPAPRWLPKSSIGVSVWVEALLQKYPYAIPTNRFCTDLKTLGAPISQGTLTGGLQKMAPLFEPLCEALLERPRTERLFHGDETRWKVFQEADPDLPGAQKQVLSRLKNHWSGLTVFLDHPLTPMANNKAENSARNPATGRKNDYGSGAEWRAELAAMRFSVLQTMSLWTINPRHWLTVYLTACAENGGKPPTDLTPFMPWAMDEARRCELQQPLQQAPNKPTQSPDTA